MASLALVLLLYGILALNYAKKLRRDSFWAPVGEAVVDAVDDITSQ
jgi:hypothetical protein